MSRSGRREEIFALLREWDRPAEIVEVADALGIHVNTARFHLNALTDEGRAESGTAEQRGPGRPAQVFRAVRSMDPTGPRSYRLLAEALVAGLSAGPDPAARAAEAGRIVGGARAAQLDRDRGARGPSERADGRIDDLVDLLDDLGFAPELRSQGDADLPAIGLRHCPFLELIGDHADVVCPVHLGLMNGALETWEAPVDVVGLDPMVEPDLCLTRLARA